MTGIGAQKKANSNPPGQVPMWKLMAGVAAVPSFHHLLKRKGPQIPEAPIRSGYSYFADPKAQRVKQTFPKPHNKGKGKK